MSLLFFLLLIVYGSQGQVLLSDVTSPVRQNSSSFGLVVSSYGNLLAVGSHYWDGTHNDQGKADFFRCTSSCVFLRSYISTSPQTSNWFGARISLSLGFMTIGEIANGAGKTFVYSCNTTDCSSSPIATLSSGALASMDNSLLAIANGKYDSNSFTDNGAVFLFDCTASSCTKWSNDIFGTASGRLLGEGGISLSGSLLGLTTDGKLAYIYSLNRAAKTFALIHTTSSTYWFVFTKGNYLFLSHHFSRYVDILSCTSSSCTSANPRISGDGSLSEFGDSTSFNGNHLFVDGVDSSGRGTVYIYKCNPFPCTIVKNFASPFSASGDGFGRGRMGISSTNNKLYIGSSGADSGQGRAFYFSVSDLTCLNGTTVWDKCSCHSGFVNENCDSNQIGSCPLPFVNKVETEVFAEFQKSRSMIRNNYFQFVLDSPSRKNRFFKEITFNQQESCSAFGFNSHYFTRSFNSTQCVDSYFGNFSIPTLVNSCNFASSIQGNTQTLSGYLTVSGVDDLGEFRGVPIRRVTTSKLEIRLQLPKFTNATSGPIKTVGTISPLIAVTNQEYDPETGVAMIEITTSTQWPYNLTQSSVLFSPSLLGVNSILIENQGSCLLEETSMNVAPPCTQVTRITISNIILSRVCNFNGLYGLQWNFACRGGFNCASTIQSNITLVSGDICSSIDIVSNIQSTLETFTDSGLTQTGFLFVANSGAYFKALVTADVNIQSVSIKKVTFISGQNHTLYENSLGQLSSTNFEIISLGSNTNGIGFGFTLSFGSGSSFLLDSNLIGESVVQFQITAELEVNYRTTLKKRDLEYETLSVSAQGALSIPPQSSQTLQSSGSFLQSSFPLSLLSLFLCLIYRLFFSL